MVSRETNSHHHHLLSPDFIAGVVSTNGTFIHVNTAKIEQFGFQIKLPAANRGLLSLICRSIGLRSDIKTYKTGKAHYALLITRSKKELINKVIPYIEDRLIGHKQIQFINWKNMLNKQKKRLDKD